jgi:integrase
VLGSEFLSEKTTHNQPLEETWSDLVDTFAPSMDEAGDKMVTNAGTKAARRSKSGRSRRCKKAAPFQKVKAGSAVVPIYRTESHGRVRFTVSFYREGRRVRKVFTDPEMARKEALFVAQRIHSGMQHVTDLKPHERDSFKAAEALLRKLGIPLVAAVEDYVRARELAGTESLAAMASQYGQHFQKVVRNVTVPLIVDEMLLSREQDGASKAYLGNLKTTLGRFAAKFPGEILDVGSREIDTWLRSLKVAPATHNSMLRCIKVFFSFAKSRNYLPEDRSTAADSLRLVKDVSDGVSIFTPEEMGKILHASPPRLIPILAIGAFSGIRMAELNRLDWKAIDLERRFIEVRASQAKTASRRIIPISDNLAAWLEPLERSGNVVCAKDLHRDVTALAKALKIEWPRNVLRHSFISYRIAKVKSADQVALEAGNSPTIIFKHYRELTTEDEADKWFGIMPKHGQWQNTFDVDRKKRPVALNGVKVE